MKKFVGWAIAFIVLAFLLACLGLVVPGETVFWLVFGWMPFLDRVIPRVTVDAVGLTTGTIAFVLFAVGLHVFCNWLWRQRQTPRGEQVTDPARPAWKLKWTAATVTVVIVLFAAGIGVVGIAHQVGWMITADTPLIERASVFQRVQSKNNLKQMGLAFHNYHDAYEIFPAGGTFDNAGTAMHSWQTALLPYVEEYKLYGSIDLKSPWDAPENAEHFQTIVDVYHNHGVEREHGSEALHDADGYALSHYAANGWLLSGNAPLRFREITDGTSNTLMAGEVSANFKPWGNPTNWRDPALGINRSPEGFGSPFVTGANMLMSDGSVRYIGNNIDPKLLNALSTPAGGESIAEF